ncbi:MAG: hypothetical protein ACJ8CB_30675 [Ktedonobacteraceae bacterium]
MLGAVGHRVGGHKDRASRFGVASIQTLLAVQGRELVIVNTAETAQDDLMGDARGHHHLVLRAALRPQARSTEDRTCASCLAAEGVLA